MIIIMMMIFLQDRFFWCPPRHLVPYAQYVFCVCRVPALKRDDFLWHLRNPQGHRGRPLAYHQSAANGHVELVLTLLLPTLETLRRIWGSGDHQSVGVGLRLQLSTDQNNKRVLTAST